MVPNTFQQNLKTSRELKFREQAFAGVKTEVGGAGKAGTSLSRFSAGWRRRPAFFSEMLPEAFPEAAFQVPKVPPGREQLVCTFGTAHGATVCVHEAKEPVGPLSEPVSKTYPLWKTYPTSMKKTEAFPPELFGSTTSTDLTYPKAVSVTQKA